MLVRLKQVRLMALKSICHGQQGRILHIGWQQRQLWSCSLCLRGLRDDVISESHNVFACFSLVTLSPAKGLNSAARFFAPLRTDVLSIRSPDYHDG